MQFDPIRLDEPAKFAGVWWIDGPDLPPVPGELAYEPNDGLRLRIISGEESFERRLQLRYDSRDWTLRGVCGGGEEEINPAKIKKFAKEVAEARNAQSHGRRAGRRSSDGSFFAIIDQMRLLIITYLLRRCGLPDALLSREYCDPKGGWRWG
jgi:hypothetical protein